MQTSQSQPSDREAHLLPACEAMVHELATHPNLDEQVAIMEHHLDLLQSGIEQLQHVFHMRA